LSAKEVLRRILQALDRARIPHMLTGSFASSYHGAPRSTQDIDLVILATGEQLRSLAEFLPAREFYFDLEAALDAERRHGQFNVIDLASGWKVDLILRKPRPWSVEEFERRRQIELFGTVVSIATPEDVLIAKLEWAKSGGSGRQLEDAAGILRIQGEELDLSYVAQWVRRLDLTESWNRARERAEAFGQGTLGA
jgi:hypothetical protein